MRTLLYRSLGEAREQQIPELPVEEDVFPSVCESLNISLKRCFDLGALAALRLIDAGATTDDLRAELLAEA